MELWKELRAKWEVSGIVVNPGADADVLQHFAERWNVRLPIDMQTFFETMNGMGCNQTDDALNTFYPLASVCPVAEFLGQSDSERLMYPSGFVFGDHCIASYMYVVTIEDGGEQSGPVFRTHGPNHNPVARSFAEFFDIYLADPFKVLW